MIETLNLFVNFLARGRRVKCTEDNELKDWQHSADDGSLSRTSHWVKINYEWELIRLELLFLHFLKSIRQKPLFTVCKISWTWTFMRFQWRKSYKDIPSTYNELDLLKILLSSKRLWNLTNHFITLLLFLIFF